MAEKTARLKFISKQCCLASTGFLMSSSVKNIDGTKAPIAEPKILALIATEVAMILSFSGNQLAEI